MATHEYKTGDTLRYIDPAGKEREVQVTELVNDVYTDKTGFDGFTPHGSAVWGLDEWITEVIPAE